MPNRDHKTDPRILRTHRLLRDALFSLLLDNSFESITIQDIAERATLNRGTFYLHYTGKAHLLEQSIADIFAELTQSLKRVVPEDHVTAFDRRHLTEVFEVIFNHVSKHFSIYKFMLVTQELGQFRAKLRSCLKELIYQDPPLKFKLDNDHEIPGDMAVTYEATALIGVIMWWLEKDMPHSTQEMASMMSLLAIAGPFGSHDNIE